MNTIRLHYVLISTDSHFPTPGRRGEVCAMSTGRPNNEKEGGSLVVHRMLFKQYELDSSSSHEILTFARLAVFECRRWQAVSFELALLTLRTSSGQSASQSLISQP
jgi:hypothetical protein